MLGLAVVTLEGCRIESDFVTPVRGTSVDLGGAYAGEPWPTFLAGCNVQAMAHLERWVSEPGLVVSIEVGDDEGERYLL